MTSPSSPSNLVVLPAPRFGVTRWLLKPMHDIGLEGSGELRQTLRRRLGAIVVSAAMTLCISVAIAFQYRQAAILWWTASDIALAALRLPTVFYIVGAVKRARKGRQLRPWVVDLFVTVGTLWSAVLGIGTLVCVLTNDPGLTVLAGLLATGTIGAQGVRSPGSPRLNILQMCLVMIPFGVGTVFSSIPMVGCAAVLVALYLVGMVSITMQLHEDYVRLIVAGIENRRIALHCPLTGLPNRNLFNECLAEAVETAGTARSAFTVLYLDLDGFKMVNDGLGHAAGDAVLRQVADRLRLWKHPDSAVARLGGDEFAVLARDGFDDVEAAVCRLIDALSQPYDIGADEPARIGVSVGLAASNAGAEPGTVMMRADQALYRAKRAGKGTYRWDDGPERPSASGLDGRQRASSAREAAGVAA